MKQGISFRVLAPACAALLTIASACNDDTATILQPRGRTYNFVLVKEGANGPRAAGGVVTTSRAAAATAAQLTSTIAEITVQGLEKLQPPAGYVFWTAQIPAPVAPSTDNTLANIQRLRTSDFLVIHVDTTISTQGDFIPHTDTALRVNARTQTPAVNFGGPGVTYVIRTDSQALGFYPHTRNVIFMTPVADTSVAVSTPVDGSAGRLWMRYTFAAPAAGASTATTATWFFGNFHPTTAKQYVFVMSGRGRGALVPDKNVLIIDDSLLARPPKGYYYETFLVKRDTVAAKKFFSMDTISLGPQTAPAPRRLISLYGADSAQVDQVVQAPVGLPQLQIIYAAATRVDADTFPRLKTKPLTSTNNPYFGVSNVYVTLESKLGLPLMSPAIVLSAATPPPIYTRP
jgi:hypothetical protein